MYTVFRVLKKMWMPLLVVVVVGLGAYAVVRIRDTLGANGTATAAAGNADDTKPFNGHKGLHDLQGAGL
jgi:siroheme synthase (precorrin-2 oxidase/ferrochelatase)